MLNYFLIAGFAWLLKDDQKKQRDELSLRQHQNK
jgi:hypothetical protein